MPGHEPAAAAAQAQPVPEHQRSALAATLLPAEAPPACGPCDIAASSDHSALLREGSFFCGMVASASRHKHVTRVRITASFASPCFWPGSSVVPDSNTKYIELPLLLMAKCSLLWVMFGLLAFFGRDCGHRNETPEKMHRIILCNWRLWLFLWFWQNCLDNFVDLFGCGAPEAAILLSPQEGYISVFLRAGAGAVVAARCAVSSPDRDAASQKLVSLLEAMGGASTSTEEPVAPPVPSADGPLRKLLAAATDPARPRPQPLSKSDVCAPAVV